MTRTCTKPVAHNQYLQQHQAATMSPSQKKKLGRVPKERCPEMTAFKLFKITSMAYGRTSLCAVTKNTDIKLVPEDPRTTKPVS